MIKEVCFNNSKQKKFWFSILFLDKNYDYIPNCKAKLYNFQVTNFLIYLLQKIYEDGKNVSNTTVLNNIINNLNINNNNIPGYYNFNPSNNMSFNMNNHMNKNKRLARIL